MKYCVTCRCPKAVAEAKKKLQSDPAVTRERRADVVRQLDQALAEVDLTHAEDGLAIFAAPGEHQVWTLKRSVPERVVLSAGAFLNPGQAVRPVLQTSGKAG